MAKTSTARARVLQTHPTYGAANSILEAPADLIKALADAGLVDPDPAAVAYAESISAPVVTPADAAGAAEVAAVLAAEPAAAA